MGSGYLGDWVIPWIKSGASGNRDILRIKSGAGVEPEASVVI